MEEELMREISGTNDQTKLTTIRNIAPINSEPFQRASDKIRDIQLDTTNIQTGGLQDFIKDYKKQSDRTNLILIGLTIATVAIGVLGLISNHIIIYL